MLMDISKAASELGKKGGEKVVEKYGREHFVKMGRKGGKRNAKKYGKDYFKMIRQGKKFKDE
jgi:general stress protein YciG